MLHRKPLVYRWPCRHAVAMVPIFAACLLCTTPLAAQTELTLAEAVTRAQGATAGARALAATVDETGAAIERAQSGYWPRLDVSETVQRGNQPVFVFSSLLSQRRFGAAQLAIPVLNYPQPVTNTRTTIAVEQPLFDAGSTRLGVQAAVLDRDNAAAARDLGLQQLALRAVQAFVRVLQGEAAVRAADAAVAAAESDHGRVRARRDVGLATEADVLAVDVHLADMRQRQIASGASLAVARVELADATGLPLTAAPAPVRPSSEALPTEADALVREALASHPDRRLADIQLQRAELAHRTARARYLPTVAAQAGWESNGATLGGQRSSWIVGAEVRVNVFRGFGDAARIAEASHARVRATAERDQAVRQIEVQVRGALAHLTAARARADAGRSALAQSRESQRILRDRYESGLATVTDLLRAAEATLEAESLATAADMDVILRTAELRFSLGRL